MAAPELHEPGGLEAKNALIELVRGQRITCELDGTTSHDHVVGICYVGGRDLAAELVMRGLARDCERFSGGALSGVGAIDRPGSAFVSAPLISNSRLAGVVVVECAVKVRPLIVTASPARTCANVIVSSVTAWFAVMVADAPVISCTPAPVASRRVI